MWHLAIFLGSGIWKLVLLLIALIIFFIPSCSNEEGAKKALEHRGYTHIEITGKHWWACDFGDYRNTAFKAKTITGIDVEGSVCDGLFKDGPEIKFDDE